VKQLRLGFLLLALCALDLAAPPLSWATVYSGDCFHCNGPTLREGRRCAASDGDGDGIYCQEDCLTGADGPGQCVCATDGTACFRITVTTGGSGGGGSSCGRDPLTGVCPAACFTCGGSGSGGGPLRV
jgi:hypothetical protein